MESAHRNVVNFIEIYAYDYTDGDDDAGTDSIERCYYINDVIINIYTHSHEKNELFETVNACDRNPKIST